MWATLESASARSISRWKKSWRLTSGPPWATGTRRVPNPASSRLRTASKGSSRFNSRARDPAAMSSKSGWKCLLRPA
ncbi:hypothetical protein ACFFX0_15210 [Citricoccus parietis]|uniref:Uncharacterized protein n=1 Tax=Citricoccus parietis TaxID=592307 RepID=A0ABV5G0M1_9MICC